MVDGRETGETETERDLLFIFSLLVLQGILKCCHV
jgi:hypothetical protein